MSIPEQSGDSFDFCVLFRVYFTGKGATSNLEFSGWNTVLGDNRLTAALIDRLVHHSHIVILLWYLCLREGWT